MATDTLARMFWDRVERSGDRPAQQFKHGADWKTITWREVGDVVREVALGLDQLSVARRATPCALLSTSRAEWVQADFAIFSAGCVTVPVYPDVSAGSDRLRGERLRREDDHRRGLRPARQSLAGARQDAGARAYRRHRPATMRPQPPKIVMTWESLRRLGRENAAAHKSTLAERVAATRPTDLATIVYTSGTTGPPKGVMQTHGNHVAAVTASKQSTPVEEGWVHLLFLPLAHSFARLESFLGVTHGLTTAFAENLDKVGDNLKETRPHFICSVPRVFEKVLRQDPRRRARPARPRRRRSFSWAVSVGRDVSRHQQRGQPVPPRPRAEAQARPQARVLEAPRGARRATAVGRVGRRPALARHRGVLPRGRHPAPRGLRPHRDVPGAHVQPARTASSSARSARACRESN